MACALYSQYLTLRFHLRPDLREERRSKAGGVKFVTIVTRRPSTACVPVSLPPASLDQGHFPAHAYARVRISPVARGISQEQQGRGASRTPATVARKRDPPLDHRGTGMDRHGACCKRGREICRIVSVCAPGGLSSTARLAVARRALPQKRGHGRRSCQASERGRTLRAVHATPWVERAPTVSAKAVVESHQRDLIGHPAAGCGEALLWFALRDGQASVRAGSSAVRTAWTSARAPHLGAHAAGAGVAPTHATAAVCPTVSAGARSGAGGGAPPFCSLCRPGAAGGRPLQSGARWRLPVPPQLGAGALRA